MGLPAKGSPYGNLDLGNEDKLMISYHRDVWSYNYSMDGACSVVYEGEMHFFGGTAHSAEVFIGGSQALFLKIKIFEFR